MLSKMTADEIQKIFLSLPVAVCLLDRSTNYLAANEKYAAIVGLTVDRLKGRSFAELVPEYLDVLLSDFASLDRGEAIEDREFTFSNSVFLVSVSAFAGDDDPHLPAIAVALSDISARKKAERALAEANKQIQKMAQTDPLTGLMNRYGLDKFFETEIRRSRREKRPISVLMLDVDWFKPFNDAYGHLRGDECLKAIAEVIGASIKRPGDCASRYGGEEFVVVLPNTDLAGARHVSGNIQEAISKLQIRHEGSPIGTVTVSIGAAGIEFVARDDDSDQIRDALLRSADTVLYQVKASGRNGVRAVRIGSVG